MSNGCAILGTQLIIFTLLSNKLPTLCTYILGEKEISDSLQRLRVLYVVGVNDYYDYSMQERAVGYTFLLIIIINDGRKQFISLKGATSQWVFEVRSTFGSNDSVPSLTLKNSQ